MASCLDMTEPFHGSKPSLVQNLSCPSARRSKSLETCYFNGRVSKKAVDELEAASPSVHKRNRLTFDAECSPIRWFYHTARTHADFYESCQARDALLRFAGQQSRTPEETERNRKLSERWKQILLDEQSHMEAALRLVERDMRLDCYYGTDHAFPHVGEMIRAKMKLLESEIVETLPVYERPIRNPTGQNDR